MSGVLSVTPDENREGVWTVIDMDDLTPVRSYPSRAAAWHHACWQPFQDSNTLPKITPGNWFEPASGKGYTSDPRYAEPVPAGTVDVDTFGRIERAITAFIRASVGDMQPPEPFTEPDLSSWDGLALPEGAVSADEDGRPLYKVDDECSCNYAGGCPDCLSYDNRQRCADTCAPHLQAHCSPGCEQVAAEPQPEPTSPSDALPEADRRAWENFTALAESNADNPSAAAYWQALADDILQGAGMS